MFIDAGAVAAQEPFDLCIVGSGPAGLTIARHFIDKKVRVLVLESGDGPNAELTDALNSMGIVREGGYDGKLTYALPSGSGLELSRYRGFGGTMNKWTGRIRPLDSSDFDRPGLTKWPISYNDLVPWYNLALQDFGIANLDEFLRLTRNIDRYFYPISRDSDVETKSWLEIQSTLISDTYDIIEKSQNIHCVLDATVSKINCEGQLDSNSVNLLEFKDSNQAIHFAKAKTYVLACGGIENARLLLSARNNQAEIAPAANSKWVGACFMEHFHVPVATVIQPKTMSFPLTTAIDVSNEENTVFASGHIGIKQAKLKKTGRSNGVLGFTPPTNECGDTYQIQEVIAEFEQLPNPLSRISISNEKTDPLGNSLPVVEWSMCPSSNDLRLFVFLKIGVSGSVLGLI
ncbi:hypothetical protein RI570_12415 [Brucella pseudogrignonensis]|uniref:hypothetical protein n=1 Tax=Brucella pseudogrignonensis TaxID=419475 RepID=UPI0028BAF835|nr:hypothetical protein [Brucella pseudogrignonensis]MDT6940947.1 hypothetical protein [Brucella pseudogrignonensis]